MKKNLQELHLRFKFRAAAAILAMMILAGRPVFSQGLVVSGQVREVGNPLPGVSILEKGTSKGTTSDAQGKFNLTVGSPTAVFSVQLYRLQNAGSSGCKSYVIQRRHGRDISVDGGCCHSLGVQKRLSLWVTRCKSRWCIFYESP